MKLTVMFNIALVSTLLYLFLEYNGFVSATDSTTHVDDMKLTHSQLLHWQLESSDLNPIEHV